MYKVKLFDPQTDTSCNIDQKCTSQEPKYWAISGQE